MLYRIYEMDGAGRIVRGQNASCADDQEAFELADAIEKSGHRTEVWLGKRRLNRHSIVGGPVSEQRGMYPD